MDESGHKVPLTTLLEFSASKAKQTKQNKIKQHNKTKTQNKTNKRQKQNKKQKTRQTNVHQNVTATEFCSKVAL